MRSEAGCGGSGLTASAVALGRVCSRLYGHRTLYLSLCRFNRDPFATRPGSGQEGTAGHASDTPDAQKLVLRLLSGEACLAEAETYIQSDEYGLCYFSSPALINPFCPDDARGLFELLAELSSLGRFDRCVLDIPADHPALFELMAACEERVVVFGPDETRRAGSEALLARIPGAAGLRHEWDPGSFTEGLPDIHGQFGAEVRELAQRLKAC